MRLLRLQGEIKGRKLDQKFSGCDLFAGPNGSGKTSVLLAIMAGLRGQRETQDSKGPGIYLGPADHRAEGPMELRFDDGMLVRDLGALRGKARTGQDTLADMIVGPHLVAWDLGDYASGSDQSRRELLSRVLAAAGSSEEWDYQRCAMWLSQRLTTAEEAWPVATINVILSARLPRESFGAWLDRATLEAEEKQSTHLARKSAASHTVEELTAQRQEMASVPPGRLATAKAELEQTSLELQHARASLATAEASARSARDREAEGRRLADTYAELEASEQGASEQASTARAAVADGPAHVAQLQHEADLKEAALQAARASLTSAQKATVVAREVAGKAREAKAGARSRILTLESLSGAASAPCRHCGGEDPLGLDEQLAAARLDAEALDDGEAVSSFDLNRALRREMEAGESVRKADQELQAATGTVANANIAQRRAMGDAETMAANLTRATERLQKAELALQAWQGRGAETHASDPEMARAQVQPLQEAAAKLQAEIEKLARLEGSEAALQQAIADRDTSAEKWRKAKAFVLALRELRGEVARSAYAPLMDAANGVLTDAGIPLVAYMESESEWGAVVAGVKVHWHSLSDGERAACAAALACAFTFVTKARWQAVLLDRMEAVDTNRRMELLRALSDRGLQVVAAMRADTQDDCPDIDGLNVVWMGGANA